MRTLFYVRSGYQIAGHHQAHYDAPSHLFNGYQVGMGHVVRCSLLAGPGDRFLTHVKEPGMEYLRALGLACYVVGDGISEAESIRYWLKFWEGAFDRLVVDVMHIDNDMLASVRDIVKRIIVIVGVGWSISERTRALADLIVYQGLAAPSRRVQDAAGGRILRGLEYAIVRNPVRRTGRDGVLVFMGGSIPWQYSVDVCKELAQRGLHGTVAAGWHLDKTDDGLPEAFRKVERAPNLAELQASHSIQVCSMGMAVYEAMAAGTPCICVSREKDHWLTALELDDAGLIVDCGLVHQTSAAELAGCVEGTLLDSDLMKQLSESRAIDGLGAGRVIEAMCERS